MLVYHKMGTCVCCITELCLRRKCYKYVLLIWYCRIWWWSTKKDAQCLHTCVPCGEDSQWSKVTHMFKSISKEITFFARVIQSVVVFCCGFEVHWMLFLIMLCQIQIRWITFMNTCLNHDITMEVLGLWHIMEVISCLKDFFISC